MSSDLTPDRQFDFSGGMSETATRFKTAQNGLFDGRDVWMADAGHLEPLDRYATLYQGTITGGYSQVFAMPSAARVAVFYIRNDGGAPGTGHYRLFDGTGPVAAEQNLDGAISKQLIYGWIDISGNLNFLANTDRAGGTRFYQNATVVAAAPTGHTVAVLHKGYAFLMGSSNNAMRWSVRNDWATWPSASAADLDVRLDILAAFSTGGNLYIFTANETAVLAGRGPGTATAGGLGDFSTATISTEFGCAFGETIQQIGNKLWMLTNRGVQIFDGSSFTQVATDIDLYTQVPDPRTVAERQDYLAGSYYDSDRELYYLFMPQKQNSITVTPKVYVISTRTGNIVRSDELATGTGIYARQAYSMAKSRLSDLFAANFITKQRHSTTTTNAQEFYICANRTASSGSVLVPATTIKTKFFHWGNPELTKWPSMFELFGDTGTSFNSATVKSENNSVSLGSITIGSFGPATVSFPSTLQGGGRMYALDLTTGQKDFKLDGIVMWAHVGSKPRR